MSLADDVATANDATFQGRVRMASVAAAVSIGNETPAAPGEPGFARQALARTVLRSPGVYAEAFTWAVLTNGSISAAGTAAPDSDIEFVIATVWDAMAGPST